MVRVFNKPFLFLIIFHPNPGTNCLECRVCVETDGKTGVEIEALNATQIALLTVYDMCKSVDRGMSIEEVHLLHKSGGRSGEWNFDTSATSQV